MIASFEDRVHQLEVAKEIVLGNSSAMLIRGDKNMDMLQSLILYNGMGFSFFASVFPAYISFLSFCEPYATSRDLQFLL